MPDTCPDCGAIQWGNATCATCRSHWPDEPDCHEGNVGANIAGGRYSSAATTEGGTYVGPLWPAACKFYAFGCIRVPYWAWRRIYGDLRYV